MDSPPATPASPGQPPDAWFTPARFALILAVFIAALFPDALFGGKAFVFRDFGIFTYPNALFQRECFWHGEFPLWNPLNNCGIPFLAQWNTTCLYPLSLIYILLPLTWGLTVFLLFHLWLAGMGMYLLAERYTQNRLAAAMAGIAFAFNGLMLNCLMWNSNLAALAWMPLVILVVERAWLRGGARPIALAALVSAMQLLSGAPEPVVFTWLILFTFWLGRLVCDKKISAKVVLRAGAVVALAALLAAAQLLPFLDLLSHSERTSSFAADIWSLPSWGWVNLFVPLFHCYRSPLGVYFQPFQDWTSSYYAGIAALALAVSAVLTARTPRVWVLAAFAVVGFVMALGDAGHLYPVMLKLCPFLGFTRYPIKYVALTSFAVPLLAAFAIAKLAGSAAPGRGSWRITALVFSACALMVAGILWHTHAFPLSYERWPKLFENGAVRVACLVLIFGVLLVYAKYSRALPQIAAGLLALTIVWLDAVTHAPRQNPTADASVFAPGLLSQRMNPVPQPGEARAFMTEQTHNLVYSSMLSDADRDYTGRRCAPLGDCNLLDQIPVADGFYSLYVREQRALFMNFFLAPTNAFPAGFADFLGISQMSDPEKLFAWQYRPTHLPFYSIGARPEYVTLSNTPALLFSSDFDPRKTVYLPPEAKGQLKLDDSAQGTIREAHFGDQQVELNVESSGPALLVLSQTYYHPWQAYVNGEPVPIWRANYAFQAIEVPHGASTVKLVYRDQRFYLGLLLSGVTLLGCLIGLTRAKATQ